MEVLLFEEKSITIAYDSENQWIIANWYGYQTVSSVKLGCEKILDYLIENKTRKVLNDNTSVTGIWSGASSWVGNDWFPRMAKAGLTHFAWIHSPSALSRLSTEETMKYMVDKSSVKIFDEKAAALEWLSKV